MQTSRYLPIDRYWPFEGDHPDLKSLHEQEIQYIDLLNRHSIDAPLHDSNVQTLWRSRGPSFPVTIWHTNSKTGIYWIVSRC